jgi:hypothetical protein
MYLFHAGLKVPPELAVLSLKRFWSRQISADRIYTLLGKYKPEVVLIGRESLSGVLERFELDAPEYRVVGGDSTSVLYERQPKGAAEEQKRHVQKATTEMHIGFGE